MEYVKINSFEEVKLIEKSLLVIDIDDTILSYDGLGNDWWKKTMKKYLKITNNDYELSDILSNIEWRNEVKEIEPNHTDSDGFFKMLENGKRMDLEMFVVTARDPIMETITYEHFEKAKIEGLTVYFSGGKNKAEKINEVMSKKVEEYNKIIFIDDNEKNLNDVKKFFKEKSICYKFEHISKN